MTEAKLATFDFSRVPAELTARPQWVLWRLDDGRKVPYRLTGERASTTDVSHWSRFGDCVAALRQGGFSGLGYVFSADDPFVGVDLDDCRNPTTGEIADWAQRLIDDLDSYAEISPSQTGVKLWVRGSLPTDQTGRKAAYESGQVELYQRGRYFCTTGQALSSDSANVRDCQPAIDALWHNSTVQGRVASRK